MSKLYRTIDRIKVKVDSLEVTIAPLNKAQKIALQGNMLKASHGNMAAAMEAVSDALKYSIKDIKGISYEDENGNEQEYKLKLDANGELEDECIDDILNLDESQKLNAICSSLIGGFNGKFVDPQGNELDGVSIVSSKKPEDPKN